MLRWPVNARSSVPRSPGADADLRTFLRRSTGNATPFTQIARANATRLAAGSPTPSPAVARPDRESSPGEAHPLKLRLAPGCAESRAVWLALEEKQTASRKRPAGATGT